MNQPAQQQKPVTYFAVQPQQFQNVVNKLSELPYNEVAGVLQDFVGTSRAMFDELPPVPPMTGPGGSLVDNPDPDDPGVDETGEEGA